MRVYLSGLNGVTDAPVLQYVLENKLNVLLSYYHHLRKNPAVIRHFWKPCNIFIDSGGFSVRMSGAKLSIHNYRDFVLSLKGHYAAAANIDTIDLPTANANLKILQDAGIDALPVYHRTDFQMRNYKGAFEDWCKEGCKNIGVSGMTNVLASTANVKNPFHDHVFNLAAKYKVKIHGFAATSQRLMEEYPFYSVDSTSWKTSDRFGQIWTFTNGKLVMSYGRRKKKELKEHRVLMDVVDRMVYSLKSWVAMEKYLTEYWKRRGVEWD